MKRFRVQIKASKHSTDYLVNKIIKSKKSPREIVYEYLKLYPNVHLIKATLDCPYTMYSYGLSTCLH